MSRVRAVPAVAAAALIVSSLIAPASSAAADPLGPAAADHGSGRWALAATDYRAADYAPTFTGNGYLGVRVPPAGQGYAGGSVPAQTEIAGFYAQAPGEVQQRASIPVWSNLAFRAGDDAFDLTTGTTSLWRQRLNLRTGVVTTTLRWRAPSGRVTDLRYDVSTDRARADVGTVRLTITPHWSGAASVADRLDGQHADLTTAVDRGWDTAQHETWQTVRTKGTGLVAALATRVRTMGAEVSVRRLAPQDAQSVGQRLSFAVRSGQRVTVTKYVGVVTSNEASAPLDTARAQAANAAAAGYAALAAESRAAWSRLWAGRVEIVGNRTLATEVNASQFYLWSSIRDDLDWSISPAGLSSDGYNGHIFWDAETWMYPSLLAQHPELAAGMNGYRYKLLAAARAHAAETGYRGARFPWESALDGTEQIPPPVSVNSEGLYEIHVTADVALAQWQYYLATGDVGWLRDRGWPVLSAAATFWASRVTRGADGAYHLRHVTGPDEENPDVNDEAYTNVAAATSLRLATSAATVLGRTAPARWTRIADGLVVPVRDGIHPEFAGYQGQLVKQADVTMLQYPWAHPMTSEVAQADLDYYVPRSDPDGPSMTDAISQIDTAALGTPGCASYVYTERSIQPFIRDGFDQFSETRNGGAFTFMTGIGGFLQEFLYGYSGLQFGSSGITLDPSTNAQLPGVVLHDLQWHGRHFTVSIGTSSTTLTLDRGAPLPVTVGGTTHTVSTSLTVPTRRPDLTATDDLVRCGAATSTGNVPGAVPLAAVDGSAATGWQPAAVPASLTAPLTSGRTVRLVELVWGRMWPPAPAPNVPPPPTPVTTLRPSSYDLQTSTDGRTWHTVAHVAGRSGTTDSLALPTTDAQYVRVRIDRAPRGILPMLQELTVT